MNIWIFNHYAITPDMPGGTRHFDLAKELISRGYDVTIFASSFNHQTLQELKLINGGSYKIEEYEGVRFVWIKTFRYTSNNWRRFINMLSYMYRVYIISRNSVMKKEIKKPDIIVGSSPHLFAVLSAYYLSRCYKSKFIMEVRDLWPQTLIDIVKIPKFHPAVIIFKILERYLYKKSKKIITIPPKAYEYLYSLGVEKEKVVYIPNGVNLKNYNFIVKSHNDDSFKVFYVGGHSQTDNLYVLLEAAEKIKDLGLPMNFVLVGDGMEKPRLLEYTQRKNLKDIVIFRSPVPKSEIPTILSEASILYISMYVSSIYKYGISFNKLFDYMASGKPIVMYGNPENNPLEESNAGIIVNTVKDLVNAFLNVFHMKLDERYKMGECGRKYVEKYHSVPVLVNRIENIIKEICP